MGTTGLWFGDELAGDEFDSKPYKGWERECVREICVVVLCKDDVEECVGKKRFSMG